MDVVQHEASFQMSPVKGNLEREASPAISKASSDFSDLPTKTPVDLSFQRVSYMAPLGFRKGKIQILYNIHGRFPAGKLIAIMGPSGAGKSTLLDVLSGYRITGVDGFIYVDGRERNLHEFRRISCYIQQEDRLQPLLTVKESMYLAADLKLSTETKAKVKEKIINAIIENLGLSSAANTRAGMLSGGQKKRLSIALELINNPVIMFLDEPTTGLDSSTCRQVVELLKLLTTQGRTIVCTIHQPSASLFQMFDQVYILARGHCAYQGSADNLVPFLESADMPCPRYHNPADYAIELACGEHGEEKIHTMVSKTENGKLCHWFENAQDMQIAKYPFVLKPYTTKQHSPYGLQETSFNNQLCVLLYMGYLKTLRHQTLTYLRLIVNVLTGIMLGVLFIKAGNDASRMINNYNLMFAILIHHLFSTMMLTILTFPSEKSIVIKEHFNRWYSLKAHFLAMNIIDLPVTILGCFSFSLIVYFMSGQPTEWSRFSMFFFISLLVVLVSQGFGLMVGALFDVVNGTFLGPTLAVPMMMFSGFGVTMRDLPEYMKWGTYVSFLRYGIEGYVGAIYGNDRPPLDCSDREFCLYKQPVIFLKVIDMHGDQFWTDIGVLVLIVLLFRLSAYLLLKWKLASIR